MTHHSITHLPKKNKKNEYKQPATLSSMARTAHVTLVAVALVAVALMSTTAQAQQQGSSAVQEVSGKLIYDIIYDEIL